MVLTLVAWLAAHNYKSMLVWALEKNSACKFYQTLGGKRLPKYKIATFNEDQLIEVAHGWNSLTPLSNLLVEKKDN